MLVVRCRNPNTAERELIDQLQGLDGVAIVGYTVNNNGREREIDAILLTPVRAAVIEAKAPKIATPNEGELIPNLNSPWTIGGETASFYGGHSPNEQARLNAQILAQYIKARKVPRTPFIQSAVSVSGDDLIMPKGPAMIGQTAVGLAREILPALDQMKQKPITLDMALDFIEALNLGIFKPKAESVEREWQHADDQFESIPADKAVAAAHTIKKTAKKIVAPYPARMEDRTKWQIIWTKLVDFFTAFIAIFLLCFFLDGMGVIDYTKEGFKEIFLGQHEETTPVEEQPERILSDLEEKLEDSESPSPSVSPTAEDTQELEPGDPSAGAN